MPEENTLRLFYIQNAYQLFDGNIRQKSEHTQAGVEFFGRGGSGADSEIIALAIKTLLSLGLRDFKVDIGQAGFFKGLIADSGIGQERVEELKNLIDFKNTVELEYTLSQMDIDAGMKKKLMALPELFGGREALAFAEKLAAASCVKRRWQICGRFMRCSVIWAMKTISLSIWACCTTSNTIRALSSAA